MAALDARLESLIDEVGTDWKARQVQVFGSLGGSLADFIGTDKSSLMAMLNECRSLAAGAPPDASESTKGIAEIANQTETNTGTDDARIVTPLKFATRLVAYAQPLSANLTALAAVASTTIGRTILGAADAAAVKTALGLSAVATSGSASDITTGTLPTSVLPSLAINDFFTVANQAAMLALTAEKGDVASRTDQGGKMYILSSNSPSTLADWKPFLATGDVVSVNGNTGTVVIAKGDIGLGNVDNTSDVNKPVSTAQATADGLRNLKSANLSDVANAATALANLGGQSAAAIGNPDVDLVALYTAAKA